MQKLSNAERKALARAATMRAARPTIAPTSKAPRTVAPCRGATIEMRGDLRKVRGFAVELSLPSPNDAADRARFNALIAVRSEAYRHTLETARADGAHLRAHRDAEAHTGERGVTRTRQSRPALNAVVFA